MGHINLIVFDEAHHAVKDSPMHQLMDQYVLADVSQRPRIIGLTGMLLTGSVKPHAVTMHLEKLENTLNGNIATVKSFSDHENVLIYSTNPDEKIIKYESTTPTDFQNRITSVVANIMEKLESWPDADSLCSRIKKLLNDFLYQLSDLGESISILIYGQYLIQNGLLIF